MTFTATWAIQDHKYNMGNAFRYNLSTYICCGLESLNAAIGALPVIMLPAVLWARYTVTSARDYTIAEPPFISFGILQL